MMQRRKPTQAVPGCREWFADHIARRRKTLTQIQVTNFLASVCATQKQWERDQRDKEQGAEEK